MHSVWRLAVSLLSATALVHAASAPRFRTPEGRPTPPRASVPISTAPDHLHSLPRPAAAGATLPPLGTTYYFDQNIDHSNPSLGTFRQRYWMDWEFYQPGGPIVLFTPGEVNAAAYTGYLTNATINGQIAQQEHGASIVLEHRYFGESNPYKNLSTTSMKYLTVSQAIQDIVVFAKTVSLPMPNGTAVNAPATPWVLVGGSYSGALTAWTIGSQPGVFAAGYASSAVVQAIVDFWQYFEPIRQFMPQNCSNDVAAVISHVDQVFTNGTASDKTTLINLFGWHTLEDHLDDASGSLRYNLFDWQSLQPESGPNQLFFQFCDALETKGGQVAPAAGWGLTTALQQYSNYWKNTYYPYLCGSDDAITCFGSYDPTSWLYTNIQLDNPTRSWNWLVCNELGWFEDGAPSGKPSIASRLMVPSYVERQCAFTFPGAPNFNGSPTPTPAVTNFNSLYNGVNMRGTNLFFANGQRDPWRGATVSADGLSVASTSTQPIGVSDGFHCSDLITKNGQIDATVLAVQKQGLAAIKGWLAGRVPAKRHAGRFGHEFPEH